LAGKSQSEIPTDFETALVELEALVERLERGDLPLEEALLSFERGVGLTRQCQSALQNAQQKVTILLKRPGGQDDAQHSIENFDAG
jgi:exodeoxyribonuclease VII small subunit